MKIDTTNLKDTGINDISQPFFEMIYRYNFLKSIQNNVDPKSEKIQKFGF